MKDKIEQKSRLIIFASARNHYQQYVDMVRMLSPNFDKTIIFGFTHVFKGFLINKEKYAVEIRERHKGDNFYKLLKEVNRTGTEKDVIIFDEPFERLRSLIVAFFCLGLKAKKYMIIHDVNKWFTLPLLMNKKYLFEIFARKVVVQKLDGIIVLTPELRDFIKNCCFYKSLYLCFLLFFFQARSDVRRSKKMLL